MTEKELLRELEQKLTTEYKDTLSAISQKIAYYTKDFDKDNKLYQKRLKDGEIDKKAYQKWYKEQVTTSKWCNQMVKDLSDDLANVNAKSAEIMYGYTEDSFSLGCLDASKEIKEYTNFDLIDKKQAEELLEDNKKLLPKPKTNIPKDKRWNQRRIQSSLLQSALKGEAIPKLAKRLEVVVGMNKTSAIRNARTMMTASHNMGKLETGYEALEMGINVRKKWLATYDNRTRDSHASLNGEIVDIDEEFSNGLMYPADPDGDPAEVYNCRCSFRYVHADKQSGMSKEEFDEKVEEVGKKKEAFKQANKDLKNGAGQQAKEPFVEAKTKDEAVKYAHKFADDVNYNGISLKNANIINEQLNELTQKYPINKLDEITTGSRGIMSANWHTLNINGKKLGKVIEDEELNYKLNQAMARASIENYKKRFPKMPPDIQRRVDSLEAELRYTRWGVQSSYPDHIKCVVTHEYGHILSDQYFGMINDNRANPHISNNWSIRGVQQKWKDVYKKAGQTGDIFKLSQYGGKNVKEFFAETFLAREMGEKLPKYIEDLMEETLRNGIL